MSGRLWIAAVVLLLALLAFTPAAGAASGPQWLLQHPASDTLGAVDFVSPTVGYAAATETGGPRVVKTTDGGASWTALAGSGSFVPHVVRVLGANSCVLDEHMSTTDGGLSWLFASTGPSASVECFLNDQQGWLTDDPSTTISRTTDGGATWTKYALPKTWPLGGNCPIHAIDFIDSLHGWAAGVGRLVLSTDDGGLTWTTVHAYDGDYKPSFVSIEFMSESHGWAISVNSGFSNGGSLMETTDGGATWQSRYLAVGSLLVLNQVLFVSPTEGWVVGGQDVQPGTVAHTTDGGVSWAIMSLPQGVGGLMAASFPTSYQGWFVGVNGTILRYTAPDSNAPTVTLSGVSEGDWYRGAVTIRLTANDGESGIKALTYVLDGVKTTVAASSAQFTVPVSPNGRHVLTYQATDVADNTCSDQFVTFKTDSVGPVTRAASTTGRKGHAISLRYRVTDSQSPTAVAIRVLVKNRRGVAVKTFRRSAVATAVWRKLRWTPRARGTYRYSIYARDLAGNKQSRIGSAKITVR